MVWIQNADLELGGVFQWNKRLTVCQCLKLIVCVFTIAECSVILLICRLAASPEKCIWTKRYVNLADLAWQISYVLPCESRVLWHTSLFERCLALLVSWVDLCMILNSNTGC